MDIGYCIDCNEMNYAIPTQNGVYGRNNMSNNHFGHRQFVFGPPNEYPPPIRTALIKLQSLQPISHNEIVLFKLSMDLDRIIEKELDKQKNAEKQAELLNTKKKRK